MSYMVCHFGKYKLGNVFGLQKHNQRENENVDKNETRAITEEDYKQEVYTREEYEAENSKQRATIGKPQLVNKEPRWLRIDLQVYEVSKNEFTACSFWEWKTKPIVLFTDISSIYVSEGGIIPTATTKNPMVSIYKQRIDSLEYMKTTHNKLKVDESSKGMMGIVKLNNGSEIQPVIGHMGMTQTPVKRVNSSISEIVINTTYIHKQVAAGTPSFDSKGKPCFGLSISVDEHAARVSVKF